MLDAHLLVRARSAHRYIPAGSRQLIGPGRPGQARRNRVPLKAVAPSAGEAGSAASSRNVDLSAYPEPDSVLVGCRAADRVQQAC